MIRQFFAQLDENNIVTDVHCVTQEFLDANPERYTGLWVETFRDVEGVVYAGVGYGYDPITNTFIAPVIAD